MRRSDQGLPEYMYWCREGGQYNCLNFVLMSDAEELPLALEVAINTPGCTAKEPILLQVDGVNLLKMDVQSAARLAHNLLEAVTMVSQPNG